MRLFWSSNPQEEQNLKRVPAILDSPDHIIFYSVLLLVVESRNIFIEAELNSLLQEGNAA